MTHSNGSHSTYGDRITFLEKIIIGTLGEDGNPQEGLVHSVRRIDKKVDWILRGGAAFCTLIAARALGVPTDTFFGALGSFLHGSLLLIQSVKP